MNEIKVGVKGSKLISRIWGRPISSLQTLIRSCHSTMCSSNKPRNINAGFYFLHPELLFSLCHQFTGKQESSTNEKLSQYLLLIQVRSFEKNQKNPLPM
jgi:hypothetical protein